MPSPYPTSAQAIYDRLLADTTIAANLGVYALANGTTRPSIGGWRGSCRFPGNLG